jgi:hypothetical protein
VLVEEEEEGEEQPPPASFGWTPELRKLTLHYEQYGEEDKHAEWRLSEFLMLKRRQLEVLTLSFEATKVLRILPLSIRKKKVFNLAPPACMVREQFFRTLDTQHKSFHLKTDTSKKGL